MKTSIHIFLLLVCSLRVLESLGQVTQAINGYPGFGTYYVGWDASANSSLIPLTVQHLGTNDIDFLVGGTQYMTIKGTAYVTSAPGSVGIGTALPLASLNIDGSGFGPLGQGNVFRTDVPTSVNQSLWLMYHGANEVFQIEDNIPSLCTFVGCMGTTHALAFHAFVGNRARAVVVSPDQQRSVSSAGS